MGRRGHCLVLAYPVQGHQSHASVLQVIGTPRLGIRITLVTTCFYSKNLQKVPPSIALETISERVLVLLFMGGVLIVAIPYWSDQNTNAKLMTNVWKVGIRASTDDKRIFLYE
ncbi:Anthocyanidin 3-O-glucoside 5-O-glucosyltransferase, partial [Mucuna pruriens]